MNRIVSHEISKFGKIDIAFHNYSTDFYDALKDNRIIDYLKEIDQLGFISKSHPGNNHKRWDYIMLQLYFLHKLSNKNYRFGLNSSNHRINDIKITSLEILQIVVLFSNLGHLKGTLSPEIALFKYLNQNKNKKEELINPILSIEPRWSKFIDKIFYTNDFYKVKYIIALNYVFNHLKDSQIPDIIYYYLEESTSNENIKKLNSILKRVRTISFLYLDSFNSSFAFHIDITKILINSYNYKTLFTPISQDYDAFFESCETALAKKIYISEKSCLNLIENEESFEKHLRKKKDFSDFLNSEKDNGSPLVEAHDKNCFQYYLSKENSNLMGTSFDVFDYEDPLNNLLILEKELRKRLNIKLINKKHKINLIFNQRKSLFFNNIIIDDKYFNVQDFDQFLLNYFNVHLQFLSSFKLKRLDSEYDQIFKNTFQKHYARKVFLQLFRIVFKSDSSVKISAYIKYNYQDLIKNLGENISGFTPTGLLSSKKTFLELTKELIDTSILPLDIKNNIKLAQEIVINSKVKKSVKIFFCLLPVEIEKVKQDSAQLYNQQIHETNTTITDIDLCVCLFNKSQLDLYFIEGKKVRKGFEKKIKEDFENNIQPNLRFENSFSEAKIVETGSFKGGYINVNVGL